MSKQQDDFEELELYLQKAQEELLSSFEVEGTKEIGRNNGTDNTAKDKGDVTQRKTDSLSDIVNLYDNVEFYKENEKIKPVSKSKNLSSNKSCNKSSDKYDANLKSMNNRKLDEADSITTLSKLKNSEEVSDLDGSLLQSLTCKDVKNRSCGSQAVEKTGHENHTDDLSDCTFTKSVLNGSIGTRLSDRESTQKHLQEVSHHLAQGGNYGGSGSKIEVTSENIASFSVNDTQIDGKQPSYLTGDNSQLDNGKSDREIEGGALMRLQPSDVSILKNDGYTSNQIERFNGGNSEDESCETLIDKKRSNLTGLYHKHEPESVVNCVIRKNDINKSGSAFSRDFEAISSENSNYTKCDLDEFLEEINDSIDLLISKGKNEKCSRCGSNNCKIEDKSENDITCVKGDISDSIMCSNSVMSDSGVSFISRSDVSESCFSYTSSDSGYGHSHSSQSNSDQGRESVDKYSGKGSNNMDVTNSEDTEGDAIEDTEDVFKGDNDEVVETDAGFYWLTCSIEEGKDVGNTEAECTVIDQNDETVTDEVSELTDAVSNDKILENLIGDMEEKVTTSSSDRNLVNGKSINENICEEDKKENVKCLEKQKEYTGIEKTQLPKYNSNILTKSPLPLLSHGSLQSLQDELAKSEKFHGLVADKVDSRYKRKYSCPPGMFRIFKVVSVDIPKIDAKGKSRSQENVKRLSLKNLEKRHSKDSMNGNEVKDSKRHSLEALLSRRKKDQAGNRPVKELLDKHVLKARIEPPVMFRDKPDEEITAGPILKPPPDFDTTCEAPGMDTQQLPPPVWDPGVSLGSSLKHPREVTPQSVTNIPCTPSPPPVDRTEQLVSDILKRHKHRKHSADLNNGLDFLKPAEIWRRKSADSGISNQYAELDLYQNDSSRPIKKRTDSKLEETGAMPLETENYKHNFKPDFKSDDRSEVSDILSGYVNPVNSSDYQEIQLYQEIPPRRNVMHKKSEAELAKMLDLIESYQIGAKSDSEFSEGKRASVETEDCHSNEEKIANTSATNSLDRRKNEDSESLATVAMEMEDEDPDAIYATVDKSRPRLPTPEKVVPDVESTEPPPIPPKPKYLSEAFKSKNSLTDIEKEQSSDLQVMLNSLSPVLLRRNFSNRSQRKQGSSTETSPDSTPDISPRLPTDFRENQSQASKATPTESLFMDPEMSKTWHGTTSTDWSQYYGPQMRAMMKKLSQLQNAEITASNDGTKMSTESLDEVKSNTLPSKSLLDEMHKKFCADQYMNGKDTEMTRALVLFRLKAQQSPSKTRRSQSFNIRMGTGAALARLGLNTSGSSLSTESSPRFPRASERLKIKTRPDVQYSPRPGRVRGVTPEPLKLEDSDNQARNAQKEEAAKNMPSDILEEIEAIEACRWLRETGFPQYAQLYEDGQFPLDIDSVEKDHDFLDKEDIQSLFRRLNTLNKCAIMKIATPTKKEAEESDEEDLCALSDKWKYQRTSRRWSRKDLDCPSIVNQNGQPVLKSASSHDSLLADQNSSSETGDSPVLDCKMLHTGDDAVFKTSTPSYDTNGNATTGKSPRVIRRAASERIKGAKSFLKRMESLKGKRSRKHKTITEISGPVVADSADMQAKIKHLNCRDINMTVDANSNIPETKEFLVKGESEAKVNFSQELIISPRNEALTVVTPNRLDNSSALNSSASALKPGNTDISTDISTDLSNISANGAIGLDLSVRSHHSNSSDATNSSQETLFIPGEYRPGKFPTLLDDSLFTSDSNARTRSYSYADENCEKNAKQSRRGSHDPRKQINRISIYDNVPIEEDLATAQQELDIILSELFQNINGLNKAINGENAEVFEPPVSDTFLDDSSVSNDSQNADIDGNIVGNGDITNPDENEVISGTLSSPDISDHETQLEDMSHDDSAEHIVVRERRDSGVGSSLTRTNSERRKYRIRWHSFQKSHRPTSESRNLQLYNLSAGQILRLRKLSLLKLTALIEKYAPNRSGWSLTVPRFMKRNKVPDFRDKNVFGVPFSVMIQRTGQPLPQCILHAMRFLRRTAGDALGIFRKSGVRSRIQKLRNDIEADPEAVDFEDLQAYDVADLVKQYFRELPECLLTTKLSDIFISIFIYVPAELRLEALQAAVILMTDENRDVLQSLLLFLSDIAKYANKHQMTASNLAVCFAPSLFNMGSARNVSQTPSPRRNRKNPGIPDARELMEQKAAHECLTVMVNEVKKLFTIPAVTLSKCRVFDEDPITLEDLDKHSEDGSSGYTAHIESCIQGLLKESREKFRGWVSMSFPNDIDVAYKKVGDGHPLRLWKCTVDVEAPPTEVLNRVLNDRQKWDEDLLQWNTVEKLDDQSEVFQYVRNCMAPHPTRDYCVLRSWRTDLPKGACVLISTSIDHKEADLLGGIRAVELASRYLIEPCGTGKSRLTHISRVDLRGHSPEWYKKVYGHICANFMDHIRASFHCNSEGPETKV